MYLTRLRLQPEGSPLALKADFGGWLAFPEGDAGVFLFGCSEEVKRVCRIPQR